MKPELSVVGIDLAKSIFHLVGMDERGQLILRKRLARGEVLPFMAKLPRVQRVAGRITERGHCESRGTRGNGWHRNTCNPL